MRLSSPRVPPLSDAELSPRQKEVLGPLAERGPTGKPGPVLNIFRTMAHAPDALTAFLSWGSYILSRRSGLPARERELIILRTGFLCRSGYEWTQHVEIGLACGLKADEIARIKQGPEAAGWSPADQALLLAADALHHDHHIPDDVWAKLSAHFDRKSCMDVVFTVGQYTQVSMILNSFGVQLDAGQTLDPDLKA